MPGNAPEPGALGFYCRACPDDTIVLGDDEFLVTALSLGQDQNGAPVQLFLLRSLTEALADSDRKLVRTLASQALIAILVAALLGWWVTRSSLKPLSRLVGFMRRVGESGDYSLRFDASNPEAPEASAGLDEPVRTVPAAGRSGNEVAMLGLELNRMLEIIEERNTSIRSAHARLEATVGELQQKDNELRHLQKMEAIGLLEVDRGGSQAGGRRGRFPVPADAGAICSLER